jgi:hypothetical protein
LAQKHYILSYDGTITKIALLSLPEYIIIIFDLTPLQLKDDEINGIKQQWH